MARIAPTRLAESWDNVGLLLGDRRGPARRVMTCLTITPAVVSEAEAEKVDLIIAHHPLPFKPLPKISCDSVTGELVWRLCRAGVAVYSAHTAYDSAAGGINDQICQGLGIEDPAPLIPADSLNAADALIPADASVSGTGPLDAAGDRPVAVGAGRFGRLRTPLAAADLLGQATQFFRATRPRFVGDPDRRLARVAVACGSGGSFLAAARRAGCDSLITGEATFHQCLEAENTGLSMILVGHYASERFAMENLARHLPAVLETLTRSAKLTSQTDPSAGSGSSSGELQECRVWASVAERDVIGVDPVSQNP